MQAATRQGEVLFDSSQPFAMEDWQRGYRSLKQESTYEIDDVEGEIPLDLQGTLFRNGPGLLDIFGHPLQHPFDGDGMISAIAFSNGRAVYQNRYVRTEGFVNEQTAKKPLYRGVFGTPKPGGWLANAFDFEIKNIANTQVIYWGDRLLALWEAAEPYRLEPQSLSTIGKDNLNGTLPTGASFAAHPWIDPESARDGGRPCLVNFSIKPGLSTTITVYELSLDGSIVRQYATSVPGFAFIHDFAITPNYCLFFQNPVKFNPIPFVLGLKGAGECISFERDKPTRIIAIPRDGSGAVKTFYADAGFVFHHVNAFEVDGSICVDSVSYTNLPAVPPDQDYKTVRFVGLPPGHLYRFHLDLAQQRVEKTLLSSRCCEFPFVHPSHVGRPYRYLYIGAAHNPEGNAPLQAILKHDLETGEQQIWSAAPRGFIGEPIFVPRRLKYEQGQPTTQYDGAEDDGWVITLVFNAERDCSDVVILDASNFNKGPIARLHLKHHVPYGLHGSFTPECFGNM